VPLRAGDHVLGVLRIDGPIGDSPFRAEPGPLLGGFGREAALALQRIELAQAAMHAGALQQADAMKSALLTSISHDLKTPLAGIKTAVSSLLDAGVTWSEQDAAAFLATIDSQVERLDRLISDILDLNRIESGAVAPMLEAVPARFVLEEALERAGAAAEGREVTITAAPDVVVLGDLSLLAQAVANLVENAAKYSVAGGSIRLGATAAGGSVEITVEDDGPGIDAADLPYVFERFYRARSSRRVSGSGLGLAIVEGFVHACGGSVRAGNGRQGARFVIRLPAASGVHAHA
jgi:two-component system sensor histidine kinase KdpD